ncbi:ABC transporter ATP-binding protein [Pseudaquabacterium rugosum]|uniref:ABC transporter ATP-binding protein n=1 Tax=Pseudaquabacterium rugosum TaxID=2984194 RepID=A0ABU9B602_9BURK
MNLAPPTDPVTDAHAEAHAQGRTAPSPAGEGTARLRIEGLTKRYGSRTALDGLSLQLQAGEMTALLGPNGAGKSTLFQVLTGLFAADAGDVQVDALSLRRQPVAALRRIGVVFQQMSLDLDLSIERNLRFHCDLHGLPAALAATRITTGLSAVGLQAERGRTVRELSGGNRRKVELARALLHQPALVLMDEPTVGLDPQSRRELLATIRADVASRSSSVLWATHLVEEAEAADRVIVLHRGRLLADGRPAQVAQALGGGTLEEAFIRATAR